MRLDYTKERMQHVTVRGIPCEYSDMRLDSATIPDGKYLYEVADGESDGEPARIKPGIMVNFFGSIVCSQELKPDEGKTIWLEEGEWIW